MTCAEVQRRICSEGSRTENPDPGFASHLRTCAACRNMAQQFAGALDAWRAEAAAVVVPDVEREWLAVRRRLRNGERPTGEPPRRLAWYALPVGAAAALVAAFLVVRSVPGGGPAAAESGSRPVARADSVEVPGGSSPLVYVDDRSGWLIVWASEAGEL